jgi:peptidoglycan/LPS O-acetylase OafA/YrhL
VVRVPQLDGLRGLAVLLVVFAHAWDGVLPYHRQLVDGTSVRSGGGYFGVQLFFVLSGFLITGLLLQAVTRDGRVDFRAFYIRRARRLLPALLLVVSVYTAYVLVTRTGVARASGLGSSLRALLYVENLDPLLTGIPSDGWLGHTWSLAVEEQFYLLWPLVLLCGYRVWGRSGVAALAALAIVLTVVARHLFVHVGLGDGNYFVMRWDALMLGALLAARPVRLPRSAGAVGFLGLAASAFYLPAGQTWVFTLGAAVSGLAVCTAVQFRWLAWRPLCYVGTISYGLYLWHVLLLRFGYPPVPTVLVSVAAAALSFHLVERPFLRGRRPSAPAEQAAAHTRTAPKTLTPSNIRCGSAAMAAAKSRKARESSTSSLAKTPPGRMAGHAARYSTIWLR